MSSVSSECKLWCPECSDYTRHLTDWQSEYYPEETAVQCVPCKGERWTVGPVRTIPHKYVG